MQLTNVRIVILKKKRKVPKRMHCLPKLLLLPSMFFPEVSSVGDTINYY